MLLGLDYTNRFTHLGCLLANHPSTVDSLICETLPFKRKLEYLGSSSMTICFRQKILAIVAHISSPNYCQISKNIPKSDWTPLQTVYSCFNLLQVKWCVFIFISAAVA